MLILNEGKMKKIAVLIPCYNERGNIEKVVGDFKQQLPYAEIYVYDNNSTDGTAKAAAAAGAIVKYERRQGKGNVIRSMFREIEADCYVMVDGDDTYPAECVSEMVRFVVEEDYDMVVGDRLTSTYFKVNKRKFHNAGNIIVRKFINRLFKSNITDIMSGYRAFSRTFVKTCPVLSKGFEVETEMTIHALYNDAKIATVPVEYRDRQEGSFSKLNTVQDGFKVLGTIFNMYREYKPMNFFGVFSVIFIGFGIIMFLPVIKEYIQTGLVPKMPSLITAGIFLVLSLVSFVCGIILDVVTKKNRQNYEMQYTLHNTLSTIQKTDK